jgi:hypothetical protein
MGGEVEDGPYLFATEPIKHLYDFVSRKTIFEVFKDGGDWNAGSAKDPCPTDFPGYALYRLASRPIKRHRKTFPCLS